MLGQRQGRSWGILTNLGLRELSRVAAVVDLAERVPDELLILSPHEYADFLAALAALRAAVEAWQSRPGFTWDAAGHEKHPLHVVHGYLSHCPDESPSLGTTGLNFITDDQLRESIRLDISAATQDFANGEWKGATVLAGSATEALLLWAIQQRPSAEVASARSALKKDPGADMSWWHLSTFIACRTQTRNPQGADGHPSRARRRLSQPDPSW